MSSVIVNSCLILDGNMTISEDLTVTPTGLVITVPNEELKKTFYNPHINSYTTSNGQGRIVTTVTGNVTIDGKIDGKGRGFGSNQGPGANSILTDSSGNMFPAYGASHANTGYIPIANAPTPQKPYGNHETPMSLGSGSGLFHPMGWFYGQETKGGGAVKIVARSGTISINGEIDMDGDTGEEVGGASGGSVWLYGWNVEGSGKISAEGGSTTLPGNCGGGSGGYISIWYDRANSFNGTMSVNGKVGAGDGKLFQKKTEPILEERFTGSLWNKKWWADPQNIVTLNNDVLFTLPDGAYNRPSVSSLFNVSGKNITATVDFIPTGPEISQYSLNFLLKADEQNWFGISRRSTGMFGVSSVDGSYSASGVLADYTNMTFRIMKQDSTFIYQYYDEFSVPQTIYTDVRPELADKVFTTFLGIDKPQVSDRIRQVRLTPLDILNKSVQMDGVFVDTTNVALNVFSGPPQKYGVDFYANGDRIVWDSMGLEPLLETGDFLRVIYDSPIPTGALQATFDSLKILEGVVGNAESKEPVIYVDPDFGSDSSEGRQLSPLKNLFVASAWAKKGSTIVLYDGTYNPTQVLRKNLTIRGAEGVKPLITSKYVQDTTGSGWEKNALSFYGCQGRVENVQIAESLVGIRVENTNLFEVNRNLIHDVTTGIQIVNCDPLITRNRVYSSQVGIDLTSAYNTYVCSNVLNDNTVGIQISDVQHYSVIGNTIDKCLTGLSSQRSTVDAVTSNNFTFSNVGVVTDTTIMSHNNNYCNTTTPMVGPVVSDFSDLMYEDPGYMNNYGNPATKDYHLTQASSNRYAGTSDNYLIDMDGMRRADRTPSIGAYELRPVWDHFGEYYTSSGSSGDDFTNFGGLNDPFRTLDKAMLIADATINIDGGHYDSYYLKLQNQGLSLGAPFAIYTQQLNHILLYHTVSADDYAGGYIELPTGVTPSDYTNVAINVVGGSAQQYGTDFIIKTDSWFGNSSVVSWKGYALEELIAEGDVIRVVLKEGLQHKFLNFVMHGHYSNIEKERAIFVSPSGSDSSIIGIPGQDTGGNGTFELPYRTIQMALMDSTQGDYIVAIAGEYPIFNGRDNRTIVPLIDRTNVTDGRRFYEDLFMPSDFRAYGTTQYGAVPWIFNYSGDSYVNSGGGFLNLTFDGANRVLAATEFQLYNDFEFQATLRNALDPIKFIVTNGDSSVYFIYNSSSYSAGVYTGNSNYWVDKTVSGNDPENRSIIEYIPITATHIRNKCVPLSFIPDADTSNTSLNIVGGVAQNYGEDYYIEDSKIKWDGMSLDGDLQAGDVFRLIYDDDRLSRSLRVSMSLTGNLFKVKVFDNGWRTVMSKSIATPYLGPWEANFVMEDRLTAGFEYEILNSPWVIPPQEPLNPVRYGRGYVSQFLAIGSSFINSDVDSAMGVRTERKTLTFYKGDTTARRLIDAYFDYEVI